MKRKDIQELATKDAAELKTLLKEKQESLFGAQLDHSTGKLSNTSFLSTTRDDIARIKTVLRVLRQKEENNGKTA